MNFSRLPFRLPLRRTRRLRRPGAQEWRQAAPWVTAGLALALSALLAWAATPAWRQQAQDDEQAALRQQQRQHLVTRPAPDDIATWRDGLPLAVTREARLAGLLAAAQGCGVKVLAVDQTAPIEAVPGVTQQRIEMSMRGRYIDVRRCIEIALQADAGLALDHVSLQRPQADAAEVDARLQFSLLQRAGGLQQP